jgi:hypothetical protein
VELVSILLGNSKNLYLKEFQSNVLLTLTLVKTCLAFWLLLDKNVGRKFAMDKCCKNPTHLKNFQEGIGISVTTYTFDQKSFFTDDINS